MEVINANHWEFCYPSAAHTVKTKKSKTKKKDKKKEVKLHNSTIMGVAKSYAEDMRDCPSTLEERMIKFLEEHNIAFDFQRIFYIKNRSGWIRKFYIADFYIPAKQVILETDGKFHDEQVEEDKIRTRNITKHYSNIKVIRWRWNDFGSYTKMKELLSTLT